MGLLSLGWGGVTFLLGLVKDIVLGWKAKVSVSVVWKTKLLSVGQARHVYMYGGDSHGHPAHSIVFWFISKAQTSGVSGLSLILGMVP